MLFRGEFKAGEGIIHPELQRCLTTWLSVSSSSASSGFLELKTRKGKRLQQHRVGLGPAVQPWF